MVKYCGHYITFQEVPNEVALTFPISNCPYRCEGCHSPWLQTDMGDELTPKIILRLLDKYQGAITCVCFMGTGIDKSALRKLIVWVYCWGYKVCIYTGGSIEEAKDYFHPDYFKEGPYIATLGGLNSPNTNQRMWKMNHSERKYHDITSWFWRKKE